MAICFPHSLPVYVNNFRSFIINKKKLTKRRDQRYKATKMSYRGRCQLIKPYFCHAIVRKLPTVLLCCFLLAFVFRYSKTFSAKPPNGLLHSFNPLQKIALSKLLTKHGKRNVDMYLQKTDITNQHLMVKVNESGEEIRSFNILRKGYGESISTEDIRKERDEHIHDGKYIGILKRKTNHIKINNINEKIHDGRNSVGSLTPQQEPVNCSFIYHHLFPLCLDEVNYLKSNWKDDKCFHVIHKVNGSQCSIYNYLTKIEPYCMDERKMYTSNSVGHAVPRMNLKGLLELFSDNIYKWMRERATFMWPSWVAGGKNFLKNSSKYKKKKVIAFLCSIGAFEETFVKKAGKGGPLGELIQWTDLIASLYILGYDITLVYETKRFLAHMKGNENGCATGKYEGMMDVIYTDINGIITLEAELGASFGKYKCMLRVLDSFGTYPEYNFPWYPHKTPGLKTMWGNHNLILNQILTLYPHTHDNSFLGFVIPFAKKRSSNITNKKPRALLYAKHFSYVNMFHMKRYLEIVSEYFEIHATCVNSSRLPSYIHNHGPVRGEKVQELLSKSNVFIGVGFPYEGPGPLEGMANGVVYLQPKYSIPINKLNNQFWKNKPTLRKLTSQNPYMEEFIGEPYCYTIKVDDEPLLRKTLEKINSMRRLPGKIPKEFTNEGLIERVYAFTEHMDFCNPYAPRWPPIDNLIVHFSLAGESCKDTCMSKGLVCERTYFNEINTAMHINKHSKIKCVETISVLELHAPSMDALTKICYTQSHMQIFSCMHNEKRVQRLCPCRDYEFEQSAICKNCLK